MQHFAKHCEAIRNQIEVGPPQPAHPQYVGMLSSMLIGIHPVNKYGLKHLIAQVPFSVAEKDQLYDSVDALKEGGSAGFQDFTSMVSLLTTAQVQNFMAADTEESKLWLLLNWAWAIGLRSPSCPSFQVLTAIWCMMTSQVNATPEEKNRR